MIFVVVVVVWLRYSFHFHSWENYSKNPSCPPGKRF